MKTIRDTLKKYVTPKQIAETIDELHAIAVKKNAVVAIAGGVAMQFYGSDRLTKDIDLLSDKPLVHGKRLSFGGDQFTTAKGVLVDVICRDDDAWALYDSALRNARKLPGVPIPVVTAEHMAALKLEAGRAKDELDLAFLVTGSVLNLENARKIIKRHMGFYAAKEFDAFVTEAKWRKKTGNL